MSLPVCSRGASRKASTHRTSPLDSDVQCSSCDDSDQQTPSIPLICSSIQPRVYNNYVQVMLVFVDGHQSTVPCRWIFCDEAPMESAMMAAASWPVPRSHPDRARRSWSRSRVASSSEQLFECSISRVWSTIVDHLKFV